jgi:hypothetical protein
MTAPPSASHSISSQRRAATSARRKPLPRPSHTSASRGSPRIERYGRPGRFPTAAGASVSARWAAPPAWGPDIEEHVSSDPCELDRRAQRPQSVLLRVDGSAALVQVSLPHDHMFRTQRLKLVSAEIRFDMAADQDFARPPGRWFPACDLAARCVVPWFVFGQAVIQPGCNTPAVRTRLHSLVTKLEPVRTFGDRLMLLSSCEAMDFAVVCRRRDPETDRLTRAEKRCPRR